MIQLMKNCVRCGLHKTRTQVVIPRGSHTAEVMFIGEAPGRQEDIGGTPFIGRAGKWFEAIIEFLRLNDDKYYVTNVVKCRPTTVDGSNRTPTEMEISKCASQWLVQEIKSIKPKVIVVMGNTALSVFFKGTKISNVAGHEVRGHSYLTSEGICLFALFHPAVLVYNKRKYQPIYKNHLKTLKKILEQKGVIKIAKL